MAIWSFGRRGDGKGEKDQTEAILTRYLDQDFTVFPMAKRKALREEIEAIGTRVGVVYPAEFVAHVCGTFPGMYVEVKEALWPRPKLYEVGPFWSFLYGVHSYTPVAESQDWMRLDHAAEEIRKTSGLVMGPVLRVIGDADLYCANAEGKLAQYRHETNELEPVEGNFFGLLEREIGALRKRKDRKRGGE